MSLISVVSQCFPLGKYLQIVGKCCYLLTTEWRKVVREDFGVTKMIGISYSSLFPPCEYLTFDQQ